MTRLAIVGFGHIGASIAKAVHADHEIIAIDHDEEVLRKARDRGLAGETSSDLAACRNADTVLLSVPVRTCVTLLEEVLSHMDPAALLLDVASTKGILMMAKSKVNGSYMMKTEKAKTAKLHIRMVAEPKPMNFLHFRMYRG